MKQLARSAFAAGVSLLGLAVVVQFLLAGLIVFEGADFRFWHATVNAAVIFFLALLLALVGRLAGVPAGQVPLALAVGGLVVVQSLLLTPYHMGAQGWVLAISALHVPNALFIAWVVLQLQMRVRVTEQTAIAD